MAEKIEAQGKGFTAGKAKIPKSTGKRLLDFPRTMEEKTSKAPKPRVFKRKCRVCRGDITEKIVQEYNPISGPPILGPGSRGQFHYVRKGLYCKQCGIRYEFIPGETTEEEE